MSDPQDAYELPAGFHLPRADHGERIYPTDADVELVVLESARTGEKHLVHADIVDYRGYIDHPVTTGVVGFLAVLTAFLAPLAAGYLVGTGTENGLLTLGGVTAGVVGAWLTANVVLYRTPIGDWLFRFLEWHDHKHLLVGRGGETA